MAIDQKDLPVKGAPLVSSGTSEEQGDEFAYDPDQRYAPVECFPNLRGRYGRRAREALMHPSYFDTED